MSKGVGSGDKLARGAVKAVYSTTEGGITQDKWSQAFDDYNPEEFRNAPEKTRLRSSDAGLQETGDVSFNAPEAAE
jgi:hypothetical protein